MTAQEIDRQVNINEPSSQTVDVSPNKTESIPLMTPEQLEEWQKYCQALMQNPPRSGGT